jgi:hypothetical protein
MQNFNEFQKPATAESNVGKPFQRYIGRDEVQKRAGNMGGSGTMFGRLPVVAPAPTPRGPVSAPGGNNPNDGGVVGTSVPGQIPGGAVRQRPQMQPPGGLVASQPGGGGMPGGFGPMQRGGVVGTSVPGQIPGAMPVVPQRPIQYSLANRGWNG